MPGVVVHAYNPNTGGVEAGGSPQVWGQSGLYSKFKANLNYMMIPCLKKQDKTKNKTKQEHKKRERDLMGYWLP